MNYNSPALDYPGDCGAWHVICMSFAYWLLVVGLMGGCVSMRFLGVGAVVCMRLFMPSVGGLLRLVVVVVVVVAVFHP